VLWRLVRSAVLLFPFLILALDGSDWSASHTYRGHTNKLTTRLPHKSFLALFRTQLNTNPQAARCPFQSPFRPSWPITELLILTNHRRIISQARAKSFYILLVLCRLWLVRISSSVIGQDPRNGLWKGQWAACGFVLSWVLKRAKNDLCGRRVVSLFVCPR